MGELVQQSRERAPTITIRPEVVERNTRTIVDRFDGSVAAVTKGVCGDPHVVQAMIDGGVPWLADSRLDNVERYQDRTDADVLLLRTPSTRNCEAVVDGVDVSMNTEPATLRALSEAATRLGSTHRVLLAIDTGDRREGIMPAELPELLSVALELPSIAVVGLATHVGSFAGVVPTEAQLSSFVALVERAESIAGRRFPIVSGGSTNALALSDSGDLPERIDQLRIGEGILLGTDPRTGEAISGLETGGFTLTADVIECKRKPSVPEGRRERDAFGRQRTFTDRGSRDRAIVAMGHVDTAISGLTPVRNGVEVVGASSDHTVLDVTDASEPVRTGETLSFHVDYGALVRAVAAPYVGVTYE